jgi:hypothetical protein
MTITKKQLVVIGAVCILLLLLCCIFAVNSPRVIPVKETPVVSTSTPTTLSYLTAIYTWDKEFSAINDTMLRALNNNASQDESFAAGKRLAEIIDAVDMITVPEAYTTFHAHYRASLREYATAIMLLGDGKIQQGTDHLTLALSEKKQANRLLALLTQ